MTEKRFILDDDGIVTDMIDLSLYIDNEDCCEKLNELHEEIEVLKQQLRIRKDGALETLNDLERAYKNNKKALNNIEQLQNENEQLKQEYDLVCRFIRKNHDVTMIHKILKEGGII